MISINAIGRVGKGGGALKSVRDRTVLAFSIAVDSGWGENKTTLWFDCSLWGQRGEKLVEHINQGDQIGVTGSLSTREHDGKTYLKIDVQDVTLIGGKREGSESSRPARSEGRSPARGAQHSGPATTSDDLDEADIPW